MGLQRTSGAIPLRTVENLFLDPSLSTESRLRFAPFSGVSPISRAAAGGEGRFPHTYRAMSGCIIDIRYYFAQPILLNKKLPCAKEEMTTAPALA
jgi:hypothetical protein